MTTKDLAPLAHTVNAACGRLGIGRVKLYELIGNGEIATFRVGKKRLVPEAELQAFIARQMQQQVKDAA